MKGEAAENSVYSSLSPSLTCQIILNLLLLKKIIVPKEWCYTRIHFQNVTSMYLIVTTEINYSDLKNFMNSLFMDYFTKAV